MAIGFLSLHRSVNQPRRADMNRGVDAFHLLRKIIVENDRDNRDRQSESSRDKRLRDTRGDEASYQPTYRYQALVRELAANEALHRVRDVLARGDG